MGPLFEKRDGLLASSAGLRALSKAVQHCHELPGFGCLIVRLQALWPIRKLRRGDLDLRFLPLKIDRVGWF